MKTKPFVYLDKLFLEFRKFIQEKYPILEKKIRKSNRKLVRRYVLNLIETLRKILGWPRGQDFNLKVFACSQKIDTPEAPFYSFSPERWALLFLNDKTSNTAVFDDLLLPLQHFR